MKLVFTNGEAVMVLDSVQFGGIPRVGEQFDWQVQGHELPKARYRIEQVVREYSPAGNVCVNILLTTLA